jgi:F-type H+-transporting ATPase subunit b
MRDSSVLVGAASGRTPLRVGLALLVAACVAPQAAEPRGPNRPEAPAAAPRAEAPGSAHHADTLHGLPKKNYFGRNTEFLWWSPQLFVWTLLLFLALWYILTRMVWKPMLQAFVDRDERIRETFEMAERLREEAKTIASTMDEEVVHAQQSARALLDQARAEAAAEVAQLTAKARQEQAAELQAARDQIDDAVRRSMVEIEAAAARLGREAAERLAGWTSNGTGGGRS